MQPREKLSIKLLLTLNFSLNTFFKYLIWQPKKIKVLNKNILLFINLNK